MSVVNEFEARSIKVSQPERRAYIYTPDCSEASPFQYTFLCKANFMCILFDLDRMRMLIVEHGDVANKYKCSIMRFWVENDLPVPSVRLWQDQDTVIGKIAEQFKEKYGDYMLDRIINS